nr:ABC transporter ATP-binding protein [uncultured Hyphomonas sp.]
MVHIIAENISLRYPLQGKGEIRKSRRASRQLAQSSSKSGNVQPPADDGDVPDFIEALSGVSFRVQSGERLGIIGRNGCGKSTLLRVLGGIYRPTSGYLEINGQTRNMYNINLGINPEFSGRQNIYLRGIIQGMTRRQIDSALPEILEFSELGDFIDMPVRTYSRGMAMRLSFSIAVYNNPEILLLDEWIGAGDSEFQKKATQRMSDLVGNAGITVIATHNRSLLERVCDRCLWLQNGKVKALGPVGEVIEEFSNDSSFPRLAARSA